MIETRHRSLSLDDPGWPWLLGPALAVITLLAGTLLAWLAMIRTLNTDSTFFAHVPRRPLDPSFQLATDLHLLWVGALGVAGMALAVLGLRCHRRLLTLGGIALSLISAVVVLGAVGNAASQITTCQHHDPCPLNLTSERAMVDVALFLIACLAFGLAVQLLRTCGGLLTAQRAQ